MNFEKAKLPVLFALRNTSVQALDCCWMALKYSSSPESLLSALNRDLRKCSAVTIRFSLA